MALIFIICNEVFGFVFHSFSVVEKGKEKNFVFILKL